MRNRRAATRFGIRRLVRKGKLDKTKARFILKDDDATDLVSAFVQDAIDEDASLSAEDGPIISFIKWLIENSDAVVAFIEAIIALFSEE